MLYVLYTMGPSYQPGVPFSVHDIHMYISCLYSYLRYTSVTIIYISTDTHLPVSWPSSPVLSTLISVGFPKKARSRFPNLQISPVFRMISQDAPESPLVTYPPDAAAPGYNYRAYYPPSPAGSEAIYEPMPGDEDFVEQTSTDFSVEMANVSRPPIYRRLPFRL